MGSSLVTKEQNALRSTLKIKLMREGKKNLEKRNNFFHCSLEELLS